MISNYFCCSFFLIRRKIFDCFGVGDLLEGGGGKRKGGRREWLRGEGRGGEGRGGGGRARKPVDHKNKNN